MSWSPHDGRFRALVPELKRMPAPTRSRPSAAAGLHSRAARLVLSALGPGSSCSGARPRMVGCAVVDTAVRDLVPDYLEFERAAPQRTALERRSLWRVLYAERHPDAFECYFRIGGEPPDIEAASLGLSGPGQRGRRANA